MRVFKHVTANDIPLRPFPFLRELSMESYLIENENILKLDENDFSDVTIIDVELTLKNGRKYTDGRIDILVQYGQDTFGVVELKLGTLTSLHLEQLEDYMQQKEQLYNTYIKTKANIDVEFKDINWVGVLVGSAISAELDEKLSSGYQIDNNIPVAALTISRYRGEDNQIYVITDTIFNNKSRNFDRTKFIYNGQKYNKGRLVLAVLKDYVEENKPVSYAELRKAFPDNLQGSSGVFVTKEKALSIFERTGYKRYYIKDDELIKLGDGSVIAVTTQWGKGNIYKFIERARELGITIESEN
ncbi:hypothetical protein HUR95_12145 [Caldalkalibacillus thermarum TA2.A1]|uniref:DUF91 domain-containing protein n=1 Tax=Caldalkalibacillus thermarum (strain TA2.A1) TaxID=986075 RepID=A0A8X8L9G6_CALTT|nr:hypothetical protein [Caldalkalibacillus thermarum]QZT33063.1 hypothetical protein HUR95_12145 [Caldalkalibacillus thermarum TA2.A1]